MLRTSLLSTSRSLDRNATRYRSYIHSYRVQLNPFKSPTRFVASKYQRDPMLRKKFPTIYQIDRLLVKRRWSKAWEHFHSKLNAGGKKLEKGSIRFRFYGQAIHLFASYDRFDEVLDIYERMKYDGFLPSILTRTMITTYSLVRSNSDIETILDSLKKAFQDPSFEEENLLPLIRFFGDVLVFSPSLVDQVLESWFIHKGQISSPKLLSYLVHLHTRNGLLDDARSWLQIHANQASQIFTIPNSTPYASLLSTLAITRRGSSALSQTITRMQKDGVTPDLSIFNALIASQVAHRRYADAFRTYDLLYQYRGKGLTPDALTFAAIFKAFEGARRRRGSNQELPNLRDLYNNLIECHLIHTKGTLSSPSTALNQSILNIALRIFMTLYDYPAAFVVLQSFTQSRIEANAHTSRIVVRHLVHRARKESRLYSGRVVRTWSGRLLGRQWCQNNDARGITSAISDEQIVDQLLAYAEEDRTKNKASKPQDNDTKLEEQERIRSAFSGSARPYIPLSTTGMLLLKNIVRLAFMVDTASPYHPEQQGSVIVEPVKAFSQAVVTAKDSMIPDGGLLRRMVRASLKAGINRGN